MKADNYQLIERCKSGDIQAREWLYKNYAPLLLVVCLRYVANRTVAEDILHESFITIFSKIGQLKNHAAVAGWMKRIVVNNALKYLNKQNVTYDINEVKEADVRNPDDNELNDIKEQILQSDISQEDLFEIINNLPLGYRFCSYAFPEKLFTKAHRTLLLN